ncbi:MAG TPA: zf-HC2 domain-containing protein, partial [Blastocatellia bacterium]|nr:zf-HC2 domain-containing protein [Blastocatellia bacterium]
MDHQYIQQYDLIDRYLIGNLPEEESASFEKHFADCSQCLDQLKTTGDFIQGLRVMTVEQSATAESYSPESRPRFFLSRLSRRQLALVATLLLAVVAGGAAFALNRVRHFQTEALEAKNNSTVLERQYEEGQQFVALSEQKHEQMERELTGHIQELKAKLEDAKKQNAPPAAGADQWSQPSPNVQIFELNSVRAGDSTTNEIILPRSPRAFVFSLGLVGEVNYNDYRVTILNDNDRVVWRRNGFKPNRYKALSIGLNATFF